MTKNLKYAQDLEKILNSLEAMECKNNEKEGELYARGLYKSLKYLPSEKQDIIIDRLEAVMLRHENSRIILDIYLSALDYLLFSRKDINDKKLAEKLENFIKVFKKISIKIRYLFLLDISF